MMPRIYDHSDRSRFEAIRAAYSLSGTIDKHVKLTRNGQEFEALCPFHKEKTPSFTVNDHKDFYHCFGCGAHGDVITFMANFHGISIGEACRLLSGDTDSVPARKVVVSRPEPRDPYAGLQAVSVGEEAERIMPGEPVRLWNPKRGQYTVCRPTMVHPYENPDGSLLGYTLRIDPPDGGKKFFYTVRLAGRPDSEEIIWTIWSFDDSRPLYGQRLLAENPDGQVLVVEGEKAADAAARIFVGKNLIPITWSGGANAVEKTDFGPLKDRRVVIMGDADAAGEKAALEAAKAIHAAGAAAIKIIQWDHDRQEGWDIADAAIEGMIAEGILEWARDRTIVWKPDPEIAATHPEPSPVTPLLPLTFDEAVAQLEQAGTNAADTLCDILTRERFPQDEVGKLTTLAAKTAGCRKIDLNARVKGVLRLKANAETRAKIRATKKPIIEVVPGRIDETVAAADAALAAGDPPAVFQRGSALVRVATSESFDILGCTIPAGASVVTMPPPDLKLRLAEHATFIAFDKDGGERAIDPPDAIAISLRVNEGNWTVRRLTGLTNTPIIQLDSGEIRDCPGYDDDSGLFYTGAAPKLTVPDHPNRDDAIGAANLLLEPFVEFPFKGGDLSDQRLGHSVVISYILTGVVRSLIGLAPMTLVSATAPGTGKGLLIEAVNTLLYGHDAATMPPVTANAREEEERKRITGLLSRGVTSVHLDNWSSAIGSDALNTLLTAKEWTDRVLGTKDIVTLPSRVLLAASGNNISARGDMVRRTLYIELDAGVADPQLRKFEVPDLIGYVVGRRPELLSAAYTILRAFIQAGRPGKDDVILGRMEEWSGLVAACVVWLGWPNPINSQEALKQDDPETSELIGLLAAIYLEFGVTKFTTGDMVERVKSGTARPILDYQSAESEADHGERVKAWEEEGDRRRHLRDLLEEVGDGPVLNKKKIGQYLKKFRDRQAGGYVILRDGTDRTKVGVWQVARVQ